MPRIVSRIRQEIRAVRLVAAHPRTPRAARWLAAGLMAYALSPIDLIPDFIPIVGHLDDAVVLPAGVWLLWKLVPADVRHECRERAAAAGADGA